MNDEQKHIMSETLSMVSVERVCLASYRDEYLVAAQLLGKTKIPELVV